MTEIANPGLEKVETIFKDLVWDALAQGALGALLSVAPYLNNPILRPVITYIFNRITGKLFSLLKETVDLGAIKFTNEKNQAAFDLAAVKLRIIAKAHGVDSEEFKKAREDAKVLLSQFVRFGATR